MDNPHLPSYLASHSTGRLKLSLTLLNKKLESCSLCPRHCGINRLNDEAGYCKAGRQPIVCSFCAHHGEETPISGFCGSGTIFFGHCNLRCVFCQNADISQMPANRERDEISVNHLARIMLHLQDVKKCHNINLVSPSHFVPQIIAAVNRAIPGGLHLPLVYNSNGYDDLETLKLLEGIIDIYMPDLKYSDQVLAAKYSAVREYPRIARQAIREMFKQVGLLQLDNDGIAQRGLIIRHLVLPNTISGGIEVLKWIGNELSPDVSVSLMAQYYPAHHANRIPLLNRPINQTEYSEVLNYADKHNFKHILYQ